MSKSTSQSTTTAAPVSSQTISEFADSEHALVPISTLGKLRGVTHTDGRQYLLSTTRRLVLLPRTSADDTHLQCVGELLAGSTRALPKFKLYRVQEVSQVEAYPFPTVSDDHCETPYVAYLDLCPILRQFAQQIGKTPSTLRIWDPYFCNGAVKRHFARLGFPNVQNQCQDFYALIREKKEPPHDCIVTNPPYSTEPTDHIRLLFQYLTSKSTPWFVVQPNFVYIKPYFETLTSAIKPFPFYLTPQTPRKYKYKTPSGVRQLKAQQLKTSPFVSMWYCWMDCDNTEKMFKWLARNKHSLDLNLACSHFFLPDNFKDSNDKSRRKKRKTNAKSAGVKAKDGGVKKKKKRKKLK